MAERKESDRPFYIGGENQAPSGLASFLKPRIAALLIAGPLLLATLGLAQAGFVPSFFEFGNVREFTGWISTDPYPALVSLRPGNTEFCGAVSTYPLVAPAKFGADDAVAPFAGQQVRLKGTLTHVDDRTMIEILPDSVLAIDDAASLPPSERSSLGQHQLVGEIVDSKCFYGVMNPGTGKVHRACAVRCLSGGIPPSFVVGSETGERIILLLVDENGQSFGQEVLPFVGQPVSLAGEVMLYDDLLVLKAPLETLRRVSSR